MPLAAARGTTAHGGSGRTTAQVAAPAHIAHRRRPGRWNFPAVGRPVAGEFLPEGSTSLTIARESAAFL